MTPKIAIKETMENRYADLHDCTCTKCVSACRTCPGGLIPSDMPSIAQFLGISEEELKNQYLIRDFFTDSRGEDKLIWRPVKISDIDDKPLEQPGTKASWGYAFTQANCIFLKEGKCSIHSVKPFDCKTSMGCQDGNMKGELVNEFLANQWNEKA